LLNRRVAPDMLYFGEGNVNSSDIPIKNGLVPLFHIPETKFS
jgi:hypothetical protein